MRIHFSIDYRTRWGEELFIDYSLATGASQPAAGRVAMTTTDGCRWTARLAVADAGRLTYAYRVERSGSPVAAERGAARRLTLPAADTDWWLADSWHDGRVPDVIDRLPGRCGSRPLPTGRGRVFCLTAPDPVGGEAWGLLGSTEALGVWRPSAVRHLEPLGGNRWIYVVPDGAGQEAVEYKYVRIRTDGSVVWEERPNRRAGAAAGYCRHDDLWTGPGGRLPRLAGVVVPVFSLRSETDWGVGDFGDLVKLIDWAESVGMKAVQLLPVNDTTSTHTWRDSYPYNGISVFALHPLYLDLAAVAGQELADDLAALEPERQRLNALDAVDYEAVMQMKLSFARHCFECRGEAVMATAAYRDYYAAQRGWLLPYACFCCLRDEAGTADFRRWGEWSRYDAVRLEERRLREDGFRHEVDFYLYLQFELHRQMASAHDHARRLGVMLKGDIPIGICRDSVPAWVDGRLFRFDGQAGAPPDAFAVNGQNWGFPTYNWEAMAREDYGWWRRRMMHMANYFDAYRMDHVLGFFRIWEIPRTAIYGVMGRFRPALPLGRDELAAAGFRFCGERHARPCFTKDYVRQQVGDEAVGTYFRETAAGWTLREEYATQRSLVERLPEGALRDKLVALAADVLFIEDDEQPGRYHPRVAAQTTEAYAALDGEQRRAYDRLYEDFFYHRHNAFWRDEAMKKLPVLTDCTHMLACAEDLGMVPASVKGVLEELEILSLEIQRMPKEPFVRFGAPARNPYLSVATIATHDMPPLRLWWMEQRDAAQAFWNDVLGQPGEAPERLDASFCREVVKRHLDSPSMLCLLALQDWLSLDDAVSSPHPETEQINDPANATQYWRYRMHLTLELLAASSAFGAKVSSLIEGSDRREIQA